MDEFTQRDERAFAWIGRRDRRMRDEAFDLLAFHALVGLILLVRAVLDGFLL